MKKIRNKKKIQFKKRIAVAMVGVTIAMFSSGCSFSQGTASGNLFSQVKTLITGGDKKSESKRLPKKQPQNQNLTQKLVNNQLNCRKTNPL